MLTLPPEDSPVRPLVPRTPRRLRTRMLGEERPAVVDRADRAVLPEVAALVGRAVEGPTR